MLSSRFVAVTVISSKGDSFISWAIAPGGSPIAVASRPQVASFMIFIMVGLLIRITYYFSVSCDAVASAYTALATMMRRCLLIVNATVHVTGVIK